jgi:hypothetical protein
MTSRDAMIAQLQSDAEGLREKREKLRKPFLQVEEDLKLISAAIAFYERERAGNTRPLAELGELVNETATQMAASRLRGMTHSQAVVAIAKVSGGVVRAQDAKQLMIKAGIMSKTKNSTNMAHNAILRTGLFDRIGPGEFRLKSPSPPPNGGVILATSNLASGAGDHGLFSPSKPVQ